MKCDMTESGLMKCHVSEQCDVTETGLIKMTDGVWRDWKWTDGEWTENGLMKSDITENEYIWLCKLHRMIEMKLCTKQDVSMFPQLLVPSALSSHSHLTITL